MIKLDSSVDFRIDPWGVHHGVRKEIHTSDVTINELALIVNCIAENDIDNYLEVGVWYGATLYNVVNLFKLNGHKLDAYGYDCFDMGVEGENSHTSGWPSLQTLKDKFVSLPEVKFVVGAAVDVDKVITHRKFDFVFHDANHTKNAIIEDLLVLKNVLNPNAFVAVHNSSYDDPQRKFFGRTALEELMQKGHYKYVNYADTAVLLQLA